LEADAAQAARTHQTAEAVDAAQAADAQAQTDAAAKVNKNNQQIGGELKNFSPLFILWITTNTLKKN
jgi:hypothetical protein